MTVPVPDVSTAGGLIQLGNLFGPAKAVLTAVQLDLFTALHAHPSTAEEIRSRLALHGRGLTDFLHLLTALGLLEKEDGRFRNAPGADRHLVRGGGSYVGGFLFGADLTLYPVYGRLAEALRTGRPQADGDFEGMLNDPEALGHFVRMMDGASQSLGAELSTAVDWSGYRSVLDAGGCLGSVVGQLVAAHPHLMGHVFDLPQVEPFFHEHMGGLGLSGKVLFHPGDFFADPLPAADVVVYGHILHDWSPQQRDHLVRLAYRALSPGGALLVYDRMLPPGRDDAGSLVASLNMLLLTEGGGEYTAAEVSELASAAGFVSIVDQPLGAQETLVACRKPPS
ncbi:MAG TPA: methyltransferase [Micromonosporaceae bacterium]|nr:methyltransferase [Micromonosporaceae bacterium]